MFGKLNNFVQHAPAMSLLAAEILDFLRDILSQQLEERSKEEDDHTYKVPVPMKHDLQTIGAIVRFSMENPLPIIAPHLPPLSGMITAFMDISGDLLNSPSLGIFIPTTVRYENPFDGFVVIVMHIPQQAG